MFEGFDIIKLQEEVKKKQTKRRYQHTLGVAYTCACLAMKYQMDMKKAQVAGLLHDYAKCLPDETLLEKCRKHKIEISAFEEKMPYLLHGKLSSYYAENKFQINNPELLDSIKYHTTGRPEMTMLEKVVFIADYIEPNRKMVPNMELIRYTAFDDLDRTVYMILKNILDYLSDNPTQEIDSQTIETFKYYEALLNIGK